MSSTGGTGNLHSKVTKLLLRAGVRPHSRVLVAVSGGADSTALLDALAALDNFSLELRAVHVAHGIRPEEDGAADIEFLNDLTTRLGISLEVERVEAGEIAETAQQQGRSLEAVARAVRYSRMGQVADRWQADWIVTAHTADDQLETVLMRLLGGGAVSGLGGIPWHRGRLLRPLIECSREEIEKYLLERSLSFRTDSTNSSERYLRNRVRRQLVPRVREVFPSAERSVQRFAREIASWRELVDSCCLLLVPWERLEGEYRVQASEFFRAPPEIRKQSVLRLYNAEGYGERISEGYLKPLDTCVQRRSGGKILAGHGAVLEQRGEWVFWRADVVLRTKKSYLIRVFGPSMYHITPSLRVRVSTEPKGGVEGHGIGLPKSFIRPPLVVRSRKPGDAIQMKEGKKSLKKLFNEWGIAEDMRGLVPVIEDRTGILAVAGEALGYINKIRTGYLKKNGRASTDEDVVFAFEFSGEIL